MTYSERFCSISPGGYYKRRIQRNRHLCIIFADDIVIMTRLASELKNTTSKIKFRRRFLVSFIVMFDNIIVNFLQVLSCRWNYWICTVQKPRLATEVLSFLNVILYSRLTSRNSDRQKEGFSKTYNFFNSICSVHLITKLLMLPRRN